MRRLVSFLLVLGLAYGALAALQFPKLTGRVVDEAGILSPAALHSMEAMLEKSERGTTNQVVVVTLKSLQGTSIEDYGYQLGRYWGIGQKDKDNGALLIVAPNERKVRIEVGYGLEGVLTDAISSQIIQGIILPEFRKGRMESGITSGAWAIVHVVSGESLPPMKKEPLQWKGSAWPGFIFLLLWLLLFFVSRKLERRRGLGVSRFGSGWGASSGGFRGGGGSFGGGGSSGSW